MEPAPAKASGGIARALGRYARGAPLAVVATVLLAVIALGRAAFAPWLVLHDPYDLADVLDSSTRACRPAPSVFEGGGLPARHRTTRAGTSVERHPLRAADQLHGRGDLRLLRRGDRHRRSGLLAGFRGGWIGPGPDARGRRSQLSLPAILDRARAARDPRAGGGEHDHRARDRAVGVLRAHGPGARCSSSARRSTSPRARLMGYSDARLMFRHVLPNCARPAVGGRDHRVRPRDHARGRRCRSSGWGLPVTEPSLGRLVAERLRVSPERAVVESRCCPGWRCLLLVFSINVVADRLREVMDPRRGFA